MADRRDARNAEVLNSGVQTFQIFTGKSIAAGTNYYSEPFLVAGAHSIGFFLKVPIGNVIHVDIKLEISPNGSDWISQGTLHTFQGQDSKWYEGMTPVPDWAHFGRIHISPKADSLTTTILSYVTITRRTA